MLLEGIYSGRQKTMLFRVIFFQIVLHPHQIEKGKHKFLDLGRIFIRICYFILKLKRCLCTDDLLYHLPTRIAESGVGC